MRFEFNVPINCIKNSNDVISGRKKINSQNSILQALKNFQTGVFADDITSVFLKMNIVGNNFVLCLIFETL